MCACATPPVKQPASETPTEKPEKSAEITTPAKKSMEHIDKWSSHDVHTIRENRKNPSASALSTSTIGKKIDVKNRMLLTTADDAVPLEHLGKTYSFKATDVDIHEALKKFAATNKLQILVDQEVTGEINTDFKNQTLNKALELLLGSTPFYWHWDKGILKVSHMQTKTFILDYLRLVRSGNAYNTTTNNEPRNSTPDATNSTSIQQSDDVAFWDELETQLSAFVSSEGRLVVNRLSGTIHFTDVPARVAEVDSFLKSLQSALHRQVIIDARILEVTLSDDSALGIDWSKISFKNLVSASTSTINSIIDSNDGFGVKANTLNVEAFDGLLQALEQQGTVRIVSQPRIRTMNNQPTLIKVGTDKTFFTKSSTRHVNLGGNFDETITEKPKTFTEGLVLSLTPQISKDRWVMLDISPVITRILETTVSPNGSTAPVLDVKQASTLVRARDGETIILGGLIQEDTIKTKRSVPFLGAIPGLGSFFKGTANSKVKKELVIFLAPRIVI